MIRACRGLRRVTHRRAIRTTGARSRTRHLELAPPDALLKREYPENTIQEQGGGTGRRSAPKIPGLPDFRRLMRAAALRLGQVLNQTELGRDIALPQPTVHRWLNLLNISHLLLRVTAYTVNRTKRLIKAPKLLPGRHRARDAPGRRGRAGGGPSVRHPGTGRLAPAHRKPARVADIRRAGRAVVEGDSRSTRQGLAGLQDSDPAGSTASRRDRKW